MPDSLIITDKDNGSEVKIAFRDILTLKLEAIPGTGYAWHVVQNNPDLMKPLGKSIFEPIVEDTKKEMLGSPKHQVFRFRAQGSGTNILELHYKRKWEKNVKPQKKFSITVLIHED
jgi:inhibitor of cysteine peptidase